MKYPLMRNNITRQDLDAMIEHLKQDDPILTNGPKCKQFEEAWSEWLGVKYSVFVNSGASANLLSMTMLKIMYPEGGEIIVPPLTWVSDIASVLQTGFTPVFVDIDLDTLGMNSDAILNALTPNTRAVFLSHIQGFNALNDDLLIELDKWGVHLIEDVCESHGATHNRQLCGSFGLMSNFSFYYAHHMTTIEGGMICTNDEDIYHTLRMLRSHGMVRECGNEVKKIVYKSANPELNPDFIFAHAAYNMRNNELGGILGLNQLPNLNQNVILRNRNHERFLSRLNQKKYFVGFKLVGASNYAFNLILKEKDEVFVAKLMQKMKEEGIEFRRGSAGGGNQLRQPYLRNIVSEDFHKNFPNTEHVHFYGFYLGNFPAMTIEEVDAITDILNGV
jgi:CDP-4-dehydro-6-deoxyglucose reductase, E1